MKSDTACPAPRQWEGLCLPLCPWKSNFLLNRTLSRNLRAPRQSLSDSSKKQLPQLLQLRKTLKNFTARVVGGTGLWYLRTWIWILALPPIHKKCVIPGKLGNLSEAASFTNNTYLGKIVVSVANSSFSWRKEWGRGGGEKRRQDRSVHIFFNENENLHLPSFPLDSEKA